MPDISWAHGLSAIEPHSQAKHQVLDAYLRRYFQVRCAQVRLDHFKITLVDGYAGGGMYTLPDGQTWRGSPLIMLHVVHEMQAAERARRTEKPFRIDAQFIFVEKNRNHARALEEQLRLDPVAREFKDSIQIINGAIEENLDDIIRRVRAHTPQAGKALFLMDPFGYDGVLPLTQRIIQRLPRAEVILNFMVDDLINFLSHRSQASEIVARNGLGELKAALPLLGELKSDRDWRGPIQFLLHRDIQTQSEAKFFTPFFIQREGSNRAYWLVHLSSAAKARDVMLQVHWEIQNTSEHYGGPGLSMFGEHAHDGLLLGYRAHRDSVLMPQGRLFTFGAEARRETAAALIKDIPEKLREADGAMTLSAFRDHHCNYSPANLEMLREAIGVLHGAGEFEEIISPEGVRRRSSGQIDWEDRLVLKRQASLFTRR